MTKFEELKARIETEYAAVTNTIDAGNNEYAYEWGVLDNLKDIVTDLEINIKFELFTDEQAYKSLCSRINRRFEYNCVVARRFEGQLPFTLARGLLFSLMNLIEEINGRKDNYEESNII